MDEFENLIVLVTSRRLVDVLKLHEKSCEIIVDGLSRDEIVYFYKTRLLNFNKLDIGMVRDFCEITRSNPALMEILMNAIQKESKKDIVKLLDLRTIVDAQGNPIRNDTSNTIRKIENQTIYVFIQMMQF